MRHQSRDRQGVDRRPGYPRARAARRPTVEGNGPFGSPMAYFGMTKPAPLLGTRAPKSVRIDNTCLVCDEHQKRPVRGF